MKTSCMSKKIIALMCMLLMTCFALTACGDSERASVRQEFKSEKARIKAQIEERDEAVEAAGPVLESKEKALDETIKPALKKAVEKAEADEVKIPTRPFKTEDMKAAVEKLKAIDLTKDIEELTTLTKQLSDSREQYKLLLNPKESFIIKRLKNVKSITAIQAATEDNDTNGQLHKKGGYTSQIFFRNPLVVDDLGLYTDNLVQNGTDCGGSIEIYKTVEEAKARDRYLSAFDGTFIDSGSHTVYGSIIIRTSSELTATQQQDFEKEILEALIKLD